ncbi:hypothetical protein BB561_005440 [Smittium simulii]|uniref:Uncharacterized protein n=1 Tax=Smittium simulii TaxID=133385 RepID=A0A2T9YAD1_9FUNG|nr:hypothetical protein BB561_005440 [Smittium simulii]
MLANKSVLLVFLLTQTLVQGYLANSNIKETKEFEISKREQVDSYQNSETFDNGLGGITKCNANGCYTVPSDSTIANSDFYSNILSKRYNSGKYVPDNRGKYVPDNRGKYVPDNRGKYLDQNAWLTISSDDAPACAAKVAPIAQALDIGVSLGRVINPDKLWMYLVILSTDNGFS